MVTNIKENATHDQNRIETRASVPLRKIMRIIEWEPVSIEIDSSDKRLKEAMAEASAAKESLRAELSAREAAIAEDRANASDDEAKERAALAERGLRDEQMAIDGTSNQIGNQLKGCKPPSNVIVTMEVLAVDFTVWQATVDEEAMNPANISSLPLFGETQTLKNVIAASEKRFIDRANRYTVHFKGNEFSDFNIDPDTVALEVYEGVEGPAADAKLVVYKSSVRFAIAAAQDRGVDKMRLSQDASDGLNQSIAELKREVRERVFNKVDSKAKELDRMVRDKALVINRGEVKVEIGSDDPNKTKNSTQPAKERFHFSNGMNGLKMDKWYQNGSQKIQYALEPFKIDYKGWKPNLLGKWFGSDSTVNVKTWQRHMGLIGAELIKVASIVGAMKAFQFAIEKTGFSEELERMARKQKEEYKSGKYSGNDTYYANRNYNNPVNNIDSVADISEFMKK